MHFGKITDMKGISQDFSDCGLHNDKYTKYSPNKKCVNRANTKFTAPFKYLDMCWKYEI